MIRLLIYFTEFVLLLALFAFVLVIIEAISIISSDIIELLKERGKREDEDSNGY